MNRLNFTHVAHLVGIVGLCLITLTPCIAQDNVGTLSGRVLDMAGEPIAGFTIALPPVMMEDGGRVHVPMMPVHPDSLTLRTDKNGVFTFTKIKPGPVQFVIPSQHFEGNEISNFNVEADDEIVSIKIRGITLYQDMRPPFGGITFGVKSGSHIEDVVVTVRPRIRIRAKVVFKDGKPLTNASISRVVRGDGGTSSGGATTDSEGYFVHYIDNDDVPAHYTISVKYKGLSAKSEQFLLEEGARYDDLVLTLDDNMPPAVLQTQSVDPQESLPMRPPWEKDAWAVNPANGHAYKKIRCKSLDEARDRAAAEGAYLLAINDEAEQKWISGLFGNHLYWIGLSDAETEGEWVWQNGEPFTYTNWGPKRSFPRSPLSPEEKDGAVMTFVNGQWHAVGPGDLLWRMTKMAILEKVEMFDGSHAEEE